MRCQIQLFLGHGKPVLRSNVCSLFIQGCWFPTRLLRCRESKKRVFVFTIPLFIRYSDTGGAGRHPGYVTASSSGRLHQHFAARPSQHFCGRCVLFSAKLEELHTHLLALNLSVRMHTMRMLVWSDVTVAVLAPFQLCWFAPSATKQTWLVLRQFLIARHCRQRRKLHMLAF